MNAVRSAETTRRTERDQVSGEGTGRRNLPGVFFFFRPVGITNTRFPLKSEACFARAQSINEAAASPGNRVHARTYSPVMFSSLVHVLQRYSSLNLLTALVHRRPAANSGPDAQWGAVI